MSDRPRAVIHIDLDAFYAAVEVLENPALAGKPLLIGGRPEQRGVVAAASYPAREYGIHSAMPMARAVQLCPDAIILPTRHSLYRRYSRRVMAILSEVTTLVEQISIDEAYLDVTDRAVPWDEALTVAREVQARVHDEVELSASLGVGANKLIAKVASDQDKPGGLTIVRPGDEAAFLAPLPVRVLWGVGPVTAQRLSELGVTTVGELAQLPEATLRDLFGQRGAEMAERARGIDTRPIVTEHEPKSISSETTFTRDLVTIESMQEHLRRLSREVAERLQEKELAAGTVALKLRYADFSTLSRQMRLDVPTQDVEELYRGAVVLLDRTWQHGRPVRLLGVGAHTLSAPTGQLRLGLFGDEPNDYGAGGSS